MVGYAHHVPLFTRAGLEDDVLGIESTALKCVR